MNKHQNLEMLISNTLNKRQETEQIDFKREWHEKKEELLKDIICFANTVNDKDCHIVIGIDDNYNIIGVEDDNRRKQSDIIDMLSSKNFAGDRRPEIEVNTIYFQEKTIDILTIFDTHYTPIYLNHSYGGMAKGCIYIRKGDKNTPDKGNASITDIEKLWKKRLGLTKSKLELLFDLIKNKLDWTYSSRYYYHKFNPGFKLERIDYDGECDSDEFYSYALMNKKTSFGMLYLKYEDTILDQYQTVCLDSGRLITICPEWGFIFRDSYNIDYKYSYKFYVQDSEHYLLANFLYDESDHEQRIAMGDLLSVVLVYQSDVERTDFESYIERHKDIFSGKLSRIDKFSYIETGSTTKTKHYIKCLQVGYVMNEMLSEWRKYT